MTTRAPKAPPPEPTELEPAEPIIHPEEMRGTVELRLGGLSVKAGGRITPAGIVTSTVMVVGILLSTTALVRAIRR